MEAPVAARTRLTSVASCWLVVTFDWVHEYVQASSSEAV
ncbi:hypothetical protein QFZ49_005881 [Streptomyces turgidiscabies]|uniref:Transposase n=1 Tax=Streptomyces turgidiscabies TaxID=85558 RepID=A0ABU0RVC3_9ACTN|nr:hypothetical protein [Streptomyces turgidiscabies]